MRMSHFRVKKWPIWPKLIFLGTNHCHYFHLPIGPFHCAKFEKILTAEPELWRSPKQTVFWKIIIFILIYLLVPFIIQNFKQNSSSRSRVMRMCKFSAQNGPFSQMRIFSENLLMTLVSFIHAYLHAENKN